MPAFAPKPWLLAAILALLTACTETVPATEVVVVVRADSAELTAQLAAVKAQLYPAGATSETEPLEDRTFRLSVGEQLEGTQALPFSFGIEKGKADRFLLVITGYRAQSAEPVIEHKVTASFQSQQTVSLDVVLSLACYQRTCSGLDQTCQAGTKSDSSCGAVGEAPTQRIKAGAELDASSDTGEPMDADAGSADASHAADAGNDAQPEAGPGNADAGPGAAAIASAGTSCELTNAKACDAHNGRQKLVCFNGLWTPNGSCDGDTRCQTRLDVPEVGSCQPVIAACVGRQPGDSICDGSTRRSCGQDLLDYGANPCPAHASCREQGGSVSCGCDDPYLDDGAGGCTTPLCMRMPCANGGICSSDGAGRSCDCSAVDYTGESCETKIEDCQPNSCANGGLCVDGVRSHSCNCDMVDYGGPSCETKLDDCQLNPCKNSGMCTDGLRTRSCDCSVTSDFTGASCETRIDDCALTPCAHGLCIDGARSRSCNCTNSGFSGPICENNINECAGANICTGTSPANIPYSFACQDYTGNVAGYSCKGQYPDWPPPPAGGWTRFSAGGGMVADSHTGLQWQQSVDPTSYLVDQAKEYCASLPLAGGSWRLPTLAELLSIVDYGKGNPAIDTDVFPGTPSEWFVTSVWYADTNRNLLPWLVSFGSGHTTMGGSTGLFRVRCVR